MFVSTIALNQRTGAGIKQNPIAQPNSTCARPPQSQAFVGPIGMQCGMRIPVGMQRGIPRLDVGGLCSGPALLSLEAQSSGALISLNTSAMQITSSPPALRC